MIGGSLKAQVNQGQIIGSITGIDYVGGLIGSSSNSNIGNVRLNVVVKGSGEFVGEIIGEDDGNTLSGIQN